MKHEVKITIFSLEDIPEDELTVYMSFLDDATLALEKFIKENNEDLFEPIGKCMIGIKIEEKKGPSFNG